MRFFAVLFLLLALCLTSFGQGAPGTSDTSMPKLERFNPEQADKSLDPCNNFFQYACGKWIKANPIPSDQAGWGTSNALGIWNLAALHDTLEQAANPSSKRTAVEAKVGDHYASCVDE